MSMANRAGLILVLALAACAREPDGNIAGNQDTATNLAEPATNQPVLPVNDVTEPAPPSAEDGADEPAAKTIPAALHGRWGLVPGDCTSTRGDDKGLVTISADQIRFYESVARPAKITERSDTRIRGEFGFAGEGMEWTNHMIWSAAGDKLTRVDSEEELRLVYTRC
jgi:hypothetical protein